MKFILKYLSRHRALHACLKLSIVSYPLSVIHYQLSIISYQLSAIHYQSSVITYIPLLLINNCCLLSIFNYQPSIVSCCQLSIISCTFSLMIFAIPSVFKSLASVPKGSSISSANNSKLPKIYRIKVQIGIVQ